MSVSPHAPSPADLAVRLRDRRHHAPLPARPPGNQAKPAADITDHLIAENTVEDHISELLRHKRAIADRLLTGDELSLTELTDEELGQLVRLGTGGRRDHL